MNFSCLVPVFLQESPSNAFATERIRDSRTKKKKKLWISRRPFQKDRALNNSDQSMAYQTTVSTPGRLQSRILED